MSKKIRNIETVIEERLRAACEAAEIQYLPCFAEDTANYPLSYKEFFTRFQSELLTSLIQDVKVQDEEY